MKTRWEENYEYSSFMRSLYKPMFVIQRGWPRWGRQARIKWAMNLRASCQTTIDAIDTWLDKEKAF